MNFNRRWPREVHLPEEDVRCSTGRVRGRGRARQRPSQTFRRVRHRPIVLSCFIERDPTGASISSAIRCTEEEKDQTTVRTPHVGIKSATTSRSVSPPRKQLPIGPTFSFGRPDRDEHRTQSRRSLRRILTVAVD